MNDTNNYARPVNTLPETLAPLISLPHWVIWRWETTKSGKPTKVPYQAAHPDRKASSTDPKTWSDFATAIAAASQADGIGFCLLDSGFGAFDADDCRDARDGTLAPWAQDLVTRAGSYAEVTVSGTGLRIIGRAAGPKVHRKQAVVNGATLETYRRAERYIVMTGNVLPGSTTALADLDAIMDAVVAELDASAKNDGNGSDHGAADEKAETKIDWAKVDEHVGWLKNVADVPSDFNAKGKIIVGHSGNLTDLNTDLKQAGLIEKRYSSWSDVSLALASIFKSDGRFTSEQIAAALMADLECNRHVAKLDDNQKRRAVERLLNRSYEPPSRRVARALSWRECRANGSPLATMYNASLAIIALDIECRHDLFHERTIIGFRGDDMKHEVKPIIGELTDSGLMRLRHLVSDRYGFDPDDKPIYDAVKSLALEHCFDPVLDLLDVAQAAWDKTPRLDKWVMDYLGCEDTPLNRAIGRKVLIAAARRARHPGCKFDNITVLESPEGQNKSTAIRILAGDENFSDQSLLEHVSTELNRGDSQESVDARV
jgi:hypothetical protein